MIHVADVNQLLLQYYLLIVEKRSSPHEPIVLQQQQQQQQQNPAYHQPGMAATDEYAKWIIEPLVICALDPTAYLRRELIEVCSISVEKIFIHFLSL